MNMRGDQRIKIMPEVYVVRAEFGKYATHFMRGGYVGIGLMPDVDLSAVKNCDALLQICERKYPGRRNDLIIGRQLGQIERFLFGMNDGDYVITPDGDTETIHYGIVEPKPYYYFTGSDGCPFPHRRRVKWNRRGIEENDFSTPFQHTIRSPLIVFQVPPEKNLLKVSPEKIWFEETTRR